MIIYPAIDIQSGQAVRLKQGRLDDADVFNTDPIDQARLWAKAGFDWIHVVDLDGAASGVAANAQAVRAIVAESACKIQLGGGVRTRDHIEDWLAAGVARVVLGTAALRDPELVKAAASDHPGAIAVGIDVRAGRVAVQGWVEQTDMPALDLARQFENAGVAALIVTDIDRDGVHAGVNLDLVGGLADAVSIPVIASGGVASVDDVTAIQARTGTPIAGAIIGRALYEGRITPAQALAAAKG